MWWLRMEKLKTMSDLQQERMDYIIGIGEKKKRGEAIFAEEYLRTNEVNIWDLRREAIKWVVTHRMPTFGTFCKFFNIKKENLK